MNDRALLPQPLIETIAALGHMLEDAHQPWWIISSAAAAIHGAYPINVGDVDVLLGLNDAEHLFARLDIAPEPPANHPRFRSALFARWTALPLVVEFMAGFKVRDRDGVWRAVKPVTREAVPIDTVAVFVPEVSELRRMFERFDRNKDMERLTLLDRIG